MRTKRELTYEFELEQSEFFEVTVASGKSALVKSVSVKLFGCGTDRDHACVCMTGYYLGRTGRPSVVDSVLFIDEGHPEDQRWIDKAIGIEAKRQ